MARLAMGILACTVFAGPAIAQDSGSAHSFLTPTDIKWGDAPPTLPKGAKIAVLHGDPGDRKSTRLNSSHR